MNLVQIAIVVIENGLQRPRAGMPHLWRKRIHKRKDGNVMGPFIRDFGTRFCSGTYDGSIFVRFEQELLLALLVPHLVNQNPDICSVLLHPHFVQCLLHHFKYQKRHSRHVNMPRSLPWLLLVLFCCSPALQVVPEDKNKLPTTHLFVA